MKASAFLLLYCRGEHCSPANEPRTNGRMRRGEGTPPYTVGVGVLDDPEGLRLPQGFCGRAMLAPTALPYTNTTCTSIIYSAVPAAMLNNVFFFHKCRPTTAAAAISSGRPWVGPSRSTPRRQ